MADRIWTTTQLGTAWLTCDPDCGWSEHDNPYDAEHEFNRIVDHLRDESSEGWHEAADTAAWGIWIPIERLRLTATAWPDDDTEDGKRCRDAGWDAILEGMVERVAPDTPAMEFCIRMEAMAHQAAREEIARLKAEVERLRRTLAVEQGDDSAGQPPEGWSHEIDLTEDENGIIQHVWTGPGGWVHGSPYEGWAVSRWRPGAAPLAVPYATALEAMEAADRKAQEARDV